MKPRISRAKLLPILRLFSRRSILVFGDMMLDEWIWGKVSRISPEAPVPVVAVDRRTYTPGGASNVAANLTSLGAEVLAAGIVGSDEPGKILKKELRRRRVDIGSLISLKGRPTTVKTRIIAHNQQVVRADIESCVKLNGEYARKIRGTFSATLDRCDAVLFSDYNKGCITHEIIPDLLREAIGSKKMVVAGAKPANLPLFRGVRLLVLNQGEAEQAVGFGMMSPAEVKQAGERLLDCHKPESVLITRGEHGMVLFEGKGKITSIPAVASQVYDVSGAGDTVIAVATLSLACGASMEEAAYLANNAAGVVVKKVGTATLSREELEATL